MKHIQDTSTHSDFEVIKETCLEQSSVRIPTFLSTLWTAVINAQQVPKYRVRQSLVKRLRKRGKQRPICAKGTTKLNPTEHKWLWGQLQQVTPTQHSQHTSDEELTRERGFVYRERQWGPKQCGILPVPFHNKNSIIITISNMRKKI